MVANICDPNLRYAVFKLLRLILAALCLATFVFYFSSYAQAPEGIGTLSNVIGKVEILRSGKTLTAEKGFVLLETDELITFDKTAVKIVFNDGSSLMAFQNARVKVAEYKIKAKGNDTNDVKSAIDVVKGKVRFFVKPQEESDSATGKTDAKFKTSNSVMGIRGTSGFIDASVPGNTQIIVTTGTVQVTSIADPSKSVLVPANRFTEVVGNKAPTLPKAIPPIILNKLNSDATAVDPNYKKNEGSSNSNKNNQQQKNDRKKKQDGTTGSTSPTGSNGGTDTAGASSPTEVTSGTTDQRKQVFNPDGTSAVISTNSSLNDLLVTQGNSPVRPTSYGDYDPIKNSLQEVSALTNQINRQISTIIQTVTVPQTQKTVNILINNPNLP
jgi:FecR protein